jgi:hypothetical protein
MTSPIMHAPRRRPPPRDRLRARHREHDPAGRNAHQPATPTFAPIIMSHAKHGCQHPAMPKNNDADTVFPAPPEWRGTPDLLREHGCLDYTLGA